MIREQEPPKPSTKLSSSDELPTIAANRHLEPRRLTSLVTGELDWIVMKCLEKERSRRYETANALGMELQRYLADEPVLAGPPSARYRLKKFLRRNKGPAIAAALVLLTLTAGIVGTTWGLFRAESARRAEAEQRQEAEQANQRAVQALRSFTDELMEKQLAAKTTLTENEKSILRNALRQWEVFAQSKGNSATACAIRADGAFNVARVQAKLGLTTDAEANFRAAVGLYEQLAAEFPDVPAYRYALSTTQHNLGRCAARAREARGGGGTVSASLGCEGEAGGRFSRRARVSLRVGFQPQRSRRPGVRSRKAPGSRTRMARGAGYPDTTGRRLPDPARIPVCTGGQPTQSGDAAGGSAKMEGSGAVVSRTPRPFRSD